ncbi:putative peripheral membrane protein [Cristinia sonorae]|uniref:Autophagy-related protein 11 n=1 Tax=Cristinia sonorae TaxID=1940300 RepID=A0A8K0XSJ5_9AGAR|nr:putative peripheral membrane protein [Cristinia sonorae]
MLQVCRAEDGEVFQVNASLWDIEQTGNLGIFLQNETGVAADCVLAYLADGRRLHDENLRELAGAQDQTIYVFNKAYLDLDMSEVLERVRVHATLQPPVEEPPLARPPQIATSYLRTAQIHVDELDRTLRSLRYQNEALRIASSALDLHVLAIADAFDGIAAGAEHELQRQSALLAGVDADLEIASRVTIHREFLSEAYKRAMDEGQKARTLGDYVSQPKMRQVAEACRKSHMDLKERFLGVKESMDSLRKGADEVRLVVADTSLLEDAERCGQHCEEAARKLSGLVATIEKSNTDFNGALSDIRHTESAVRDELEQIIRIKNSFTEQSISALRQISVLNNYVVELPVALTSLQNSLRAKTSFSHIQRLHNMLYAYGATVVEVVRRKEFASFFSHRSHSILEVMSKFSAAERKRRQLYRGEVHGQLPFEPKGLDDQVPSIDFTPMRVPEAPYSLERSDVDTLMQVFDDLEHFATHSGDPAALSSVQEARTGLEKLIGKMDALESGFDRIAERSILSSSKILSNRRRSIETDDYVYAELEAQLVQVRQAKEEQEASFARDRHALEAEISQLRNLLEDGESARDHLERDLRSVRAHLESETTSRHILELRNTELVADCATHRSELATALAEATERTKEAEILRQELARARADFEDVKALEARNADNISKLLEEQAKALRRLDEARARGEDLESQIRDARTESDEVKRALAEAGREKDRLLRAQASEHDRLLRDHIAEADGDRAVLEHQYLEMKAAQEGMQQELKSARVAADTANADAVGLREELQRIEHELREAHHIERVLREDLRAGRASQSDFELRLENSSRLVAQILDVALSFRESHVKALTATQAMTAHPPSSKATGSSSMSDSTFGMRRSVVNHLEEPSPIDPSDPAAALEILRTFDHDQFMEAINKAGSTIRKWQKQCKEYRERAKGKISFRNFAKGDLALFLPTRNSISKPWAAFNVSFPHYFLQATGHLADQLKTREWIVARITSLTERVVDFKDESSNPYGLGDGVKYYMLEVEDWTQPAHPSKRRISHRKATSSDMPTPATEVIPETPSGPPDAEVEESFTVTRPPTSRLFPSPPRPGSSPNAPSSLSRLLAQAENSAEVASPISIKSPFPSTSPPAPPSPMRSGSTSTPQDGKLNAPSISGTLRPGSRSSRQSTSSKFSSARIPFAGSAGTGKATATTALSEELMPTSPSSGGSTQSPASRGSTNPSPQGSPTEGMSTIMSHRRRTTSHQLPRTSPLSTGVTTSGHVVERSDSSTIIPTARSRLASIASGWGVSFARRKVTPEAPPSRRSGESVRDPFNTESDLDR